MNSGHRLTLRVQGDGEMIQVEGVIMTMAIMTVMAMGIVGGFKVLLPRRTQRAILDKLGEIGQED